jgi:predicted TIM-barrel fold metal-dependent hydrolase
LFDHVRSRIDPQDVIDAHVHIGGPPNENPSMYFWSKRFEKSMSFEAIKLVTRISPPRSGGIRYVDTLFHQAFNSKYVDKVVLLALDSVYAESGRQDLPATQLYVSNEYVAHLAQIYTQFLFGCSIHPYAPDALKRLWMCARGGAVLCKWLPSAQCIDPTHPASIRFFRALAALKMPLLIHVGPESAIPTAMGCQAELKVNAGSGRYGSSPGDGILMALEEGATVIVAHCATPLGLLLDKNNSYWEEVFEVLLERLEQLKDLPLYADTSAFCLPGRFRYVKRVLPRIQEQPHKFLYGSDYPVPIISLREGKAVEEILEAFGWLAGRALPVNDLDKNFNLLSSILPKETFHTAAQVLRDPQAPVLSWRRFLARVKKGAPSTV